jgi:hypothetical protein
VSATTTTIGPVDELRRFEPVTDAVVLAAIDRAERHGRWRGDGVGVDDIAEHLGFVHNSWTSRCLRPHIDTLIEAGALVRSIRCGCVVWVLTDRGRRRAARARRKVVLPESPQHRVWRHTREKAGERIDGLRGQVRLALDDAIALIDAGPGDSEAWFDLCERLQRACWRLGSATYCLSEWGEPDDAHADVDDRDEKSGASRYRRSTRDWAGA